MRTSKIAILLSVVAYSLPVRADWLVETYRDGSAVNGLADADRLITTTSPIATGTIPYTDMLGFNSGEGTGHFSFNYQVPGITQSQATDNYAVDVTGSLMVSNPGNYTFGLNTDDGGRLRIDGANIIVDNVRSPPHDSPYVSVFLPAGLHAVEWTWYNEAGGVNGGGAEGEAFWSPGNYTGFTSSFSLLSALLSDNGLIAYYPFNGDANDASGNGNNAIVYGATLTTDRFGYLDAAYDFDGVDSYIDIPQNATLNALTTNFTLSAWIYQRGSQPNGYRIIDKCPAGTPSGWTFDTFGNGSTGRRLRLQASFPNGTNVVGGTDYSLTEWHHVVATVCGTVGKVYLDGSLDGTGDVGNIPQNGLDIFIGREHPDIDPQVVYWFDGIIDDVRIYDRALSDAEIQALYSLPGSQPLLAIQINRVPTVNEIGQPTIPTDPTHFKVFASGVFQTNVPLDPNKMTVVMTHGWNGSPSDWAEYMAQIIQQRIGANTVNLVAWDWHTEATNSLPIATDFTLGEGLALGENLVIALGTNYLQRIHFVGHSLGTLVNAAAANYVHANGFYWTNTQMTLCDEAEIAWGTTSQSELLATLLALSQNYATAQPYWGSPLPTQCAWADNYISAVGLLHPQAANVILTFQFPFAAPDFESFEQEFFIFHDYAHYFYEDTIEPSIFDTGGQTNATFAGFVCSFEGGGFADRPPTNTYFYQSPNGLELNLRPIDSGCATSILNERLSSYWAATTATAGQIRANETVQAVGQVYGIIDDIGNVIINLFTSITSGSLVRGSARSPGLPTSNGQTAGNAPAYAWIPLAVPSNAASMSFDFLLQGNGNNDSFQAAIDGTNILSLEMVLIQTNTTMNSGLIDVSEYAGTNIELFLGIVGGTSTNAQLTVSDIEFYSTSLPSLQGAVRNGNVVLSWPLSAPNFNLQTATNLSGQNSWLTITNAPSIVNLQNTVTNAPPGTAGFYRLIRTP